MVTQIKLGGITVDVVKKGIKNIHLSVYPPTGSVRISAPLRMDINNIRVFAITKLPWIKNQQQKLSEQARETPREYLNRESHFVWGKRYLLTIYESKQSQSVELKHNRMLLYVRPGADENKKMAIIEEWYRTQLKHAMMPLLAKWEQLIGVKVEQFYVQRMKTKWGSCNSNAHSIRLNTDLAKKPKECLEYIVVHEMVHILESTHNARFVMLMDRFMPKWQFYRDVLNRLPIRYEHWDY